MLTGKALKDFIEYHYNQVDFTKESHEENYELFLANTEEIHQLASVIDWLDSAGIYVNVSPRYIDHVIKYSVGDFYAVLNFKDGSLTLDACNYNSLEDRIYSRQQATEKAIERANEIYNGSK